MNPAINYSAAAILLFISMGSHAASVQYEVSSTDSVIIGASSEKVTVRVTGYKNLKGNEAYYGKVFASTSSAVGKLAVTFAPENEPTSWNGNGYSALQGKITNQDGDKFSLILSNTSNNFVINGTVWAISQLNTFSGSLEKVYDTLKPGVYPVTIRAALYQD